MNVFIVFAQLEPIFVNRVVKEHVAGTLEVTRRRVAMNGTTAFPKGWIDCLFACEHVQSPIRNCILRDSVFEAPPPFVAYMFGRFGEDGRKAYLGAYRKWLSVLNTIPRIFFHPKEDYSPNERLSLGGFVDTGGQRNV